MFILDEQDAGLADEIHESFAMRCVAHPTLMTGVPEKIALAEAVLAEADWVASGVPAP